MAQRVKSWPPRLRYEFGRYRRSANPAASSAAIDHTTSLPLIPAEPVIDAKLTLGDERLEREELELFVRQADMLLGRMTNRPSSVVAGLSHTLLARRGVSAPGKWRLQPKHASISARHRLSRLRSP
jgi:hypothetical protein